MRFAAFGALALCLSCKLGPAASERWTARRAEPTKPAATAEAISERALERVAELRERLEVELPRPDASLGRRCPEEIRRAHGALLPMRPRDVRLDRRQLLPLRLTQSFTSESIGRARTAIENERATPPEMALDELRYLAELEIEVFGSPKLFRRKDAPRSEWAPALLRGNLVVYDTAEKRALCQAPISVRVSGDGESIRKRTRDVVRDRMMSELERRTRAELERALAELSSGFALEPPNAAPAALLANLTNPARVSR